MTQTAPRRQQRGRVRASEGIRAQLDLQRVPSDGRHPLSFPVERLGRSAAVAGDLGLLPGRRTGPRGL